MNTKQAPINLKENINNVLEDLQLVKDYKKADASKVKVIGGKAQTNSDISTNDINFAVIIRAAAKTTIDTKDVVNLLQKVKTANSIANYEEQKINEEGGVESKIKQLTEKIKQLTEALNKNKSSLDQQQKENNIINTINELNADSKGKEYITSFATEDTLKKIDSEDFKKNHDTSTTEEKIQEQIAMLKTLNESLLKEQGTLQQKQDEYKNILQKIEQYIQYLFGNKENNKEGFDFIDTNKADGQIKEILDSLKIENITVPFGDNLQVTLEQYNVLPNSADELEKWTTAAIKDKNIPNSLIKEDDENLAKYNALMNAFKMKKDEVSQGTGFKAALKTLDENVNTELNPLNKNLEGIENRVKAIKTLTTSNKDLFSAITTAKGVLHAEHLNGITGTGQIKMAFNQKKNEALKVFNELKIKNANTDYKGGIEFKNTKDNNISQNNVIPINIAQQIQQQSVIKINIQPNEKQELTQSAIHLNIAQPNDKEQTVVNPAKEINSSNVYKQQQQQYQSIYTKSDISQITDNNKTTNAVDNNIDSIDLSQQLSKLSEAQQQGFNIIQSIIKGEGYQGSINSQDIREVLIGAQIATTMYGENEEVLAIYQKFYDPLSEALALDSNTKKDTIDYNEIGKTISDNLSDIKLLEEIDQVHDISEAKELLLQKPLLDESNEDITEDKMKLYNSTNLSTILKEASVNNEVYKSISTLEEGKSNVYKSFVAGLSTKRDASSINQSNTK